jgi:putative two-component system response regulator
MPSHARILIVDDTPENARLLEMMLVNSGYKHIRCLHDGRDVLKSLETFAPDLILLDLMMWPVSGYEVLTQIRDYLPEDTYLPIIVITADDTTVARKRALTLGATDFIRRPHEYFDVILRVRNLLQTRFFHLELMARNEKLRELVQERTLYLENIQIDLKLAQLDIVDRLAVAGEYHDDDTGSHTYRVAQTSRMLALHLGLAADDVEILYRSAPLHDVGKIGISDEILLKPGRLTAPEFETMKKHCEIGSMLLSNGRSEMMEVARNIAISHHERFDGLGYPYGLRGDEIPLAGRIVAVADVFDALTTERPYKKAWPLNEAISEIHNQSGRHFDPTVVTAFCSLGAENLGYPV